MGGLFAQIISIKVEAFYQKHIKQRNQNTQEMIQLGTEQERTLGVEDWEDRSGFDLAVLGEIAGWP